MVLKALVHDGDTYLLCCDSAKVSQDEYINALKFGFGSISLDKLICYKTDREMNIPERYQGAFNIEDYTVKQASNVKSCMLQKEMTPDVYIMDKPLIGGITEDYGWYCCDGHGYCNNSKMRSQNGQWTLCGRKVVYDYKKPIRILRTDTRRHRPDFERERLIINLDTGVCTLEQYYFEGNMISVMYEFDKEYRVWVCKARNIDYSIIGIKR